MQDSSVQAKTAPEKLNRRQAAKVRTRHKVLESARNLFAERGYDPSTIRDIAKGAGMSTGAVFANFQDKAELFEAVLIDDLAKLAEDMRRGARKDGGVKVRLLAILDAGYHASLDHLPLMQAFIARSWFQPQAAEMRARVAGRDIQAVIADTLKDGVSSGELAQDIDLKLISEMVWDAYLSNYRKAAYDGWDLKGVSDRLSAQLDLILGGAAREMRKAA